MCLRFETGSIGTVAKNNIIVYSHQPRFAFYAYDNFDHSNILVQLIA